MTTFSPQDFVIGEISKLTKYLKFIFCIRFRGLPKTPDEMLFLGHLVALMFYRDTLNQCYRLCHLLKLFDLERNVPLKRKHNIATHYLLLISYKCCIVSIDS